MKQAKKSDPHAESEDRGILRLELQRRVAQGKLFDRVFKIIIVFVRNREEAGVDERLDVLVARQSLAGAMPLGRNRIPDFGIAGRFEVGHDVAYFAGGNFRFRCHHRMQGADFKCQAARTCRQHLDGITFLDGAVKGAGVKNDTPVVVVVTVEYK